MVHVPPVLARIRRDLPGRAFALALSTLARIAGRARRPTIVVADGIGWVAWLLLPGARRRVYRNVRPFCADDAQARRAVRAVFQSVTRYYADLVTLPSQDLAALVHRDMAIGPRGYEPHILHPGPTIIVGAHWGSPEVCIQACLPYGRPFLALVEPLAQPALAEVTNRLRSAHGGRYVSADGSGLRVALRHLREGGLLAIIADRDIHGNGIPVTLAGRRIRVSRGPWELAQRTGARLVPVFTPRQGRFGYRLELGVPVTIARDGGEKAVQEAAQAWASTLERYLREDPGQWAVLEDFWEVHGVGQS